MTDTDDTTTNAGITVTVAVGSHPGLVRRRNEDHGGFRADGPPILASPDGQLSSATTAGSHVLVVVADGLGGHPYGDAASLLAVESILDASPADADALAVAVHAANQSIYTAMDDRAKLTMGSTVAAVLAHPDGIAVLNVGDSPVYELIEGELLELSVMDSLSAIDDPDGYHSNVVTQTLGGRARLEEVRPHVLELEQAGARRLLLCTDGLTNYVDPRGIAAALGSPQPDDAAQALIDLALAGGGGDNVTIAVMDIA
jgi:serine/threonine protein phosphatase PrpC